MSRKREAPPKPEELIQKLEERFNEFKTSVETKSEEQDKNIEELREICKEIKDDNEAQKQEINEKLERVQ